MTFSRGQDGPQVVILDGKRCLEGRFFSFDVDDQNAFEIDETVIGIRMTLYSISHTTPCSNARGRGRSVNTYYLR
jgi:hypothetical protein